MPISFNGPLKASDWKTLRPVITDMPLQEAESALAEAITTRVQTILPGKLDLHWLAENAHHASRMALLEMLLISQCKLFVRTRTGDEVECYGSFAQAILARGVERSLKSSIIKMLSEDEFAQRFVAGPCFQETQPLTPTPFNLVHYDNGRIDLSHLREAAMQEEDIWGTTIGGWERNAYRMTLAEMEPFEGQGVSFRSTTFNLAALTEGDNFKAAFSRLEAFAKKHFARLSTQLNDAMKEWRLSKVPKRPRGRPNKADKTKEAYLRMFPDGHESKKLTVKEACRELEKVLPYKIPENTLKKILPKIRADRPKNSVPEI